MSKTYVALIADAIASRELPPAARARLQADARTAVKDLNQRYRRVLAARFAVTLGDELQCLLPTPQPVWDVAHDLRARLPTVDWVVACGRGPITTPLAPTAPEIDGPCFHEARAAMDRAKRERLVFAFGGFTSALEPLASYYSALYWSWTPRQRRTATLLRVGDPAAAAARLDVDRSAISHLARRMAWPLVAAGDRCFGHCWRRNPREPAVRRSATRLYAGRHALARPGGRTPPRPGAALRGGAVRDRGTRPRQAPRPTRATERGWALVGTGRAPGHRLPVCVGSGDRADPQRARAPHVADAARRGPHRRRDRRRPRPRRRVSRARPRTHHGVAGRVRRGGMDHRRQVARALQDR